MAQKVKVTPVEDGWADDNLPGMGLCDHCNAPRKRFLVFTLRSDGPVMEQWNFFFSRRIHACGEACMKFFALALEKEINA